jgi:hypothetical protein
MNHLADISLLLNRLRKVDFWTESMIDGNLLENMASN